MTIGQWMMSLGVMFTLMGGLFLIFRFFSVDETDDEFQDGSIESGSLISILVGVGMIAFGWFVLTPPSTG